MCLHVCVYEPAQPYVCLNVACQPSISRPGGGEGQGRGKSEGPRDGRDPTANDGQGYARTGLKSIVLSCSRSCPWLAYTPSTPQ